MTHLADLVADLQRTDPGRPRITWYVADGGPSDGERVELSGAVLANWASKAANLLQDDLAAGPGSVVVVDLPPHWRALYWAVAAWAVGAEVRTAGAGDVVVTADPGRAPEGDDLVVVTLPALARAATVPVPAGATDEARELASHGDRFTAYDRPGPGATALDDPATAYARDAAPDGGAERRLLVVGPDAATGPFLATAAGLLTTGGSLVVVRVGADGGAPERVESIRVQEQAQPA